MNSKNLARCMISAMAALLLTAGPSFAGVGGSDTPTVPTHVAVGETAVPFSFTIVNNSTTPNNVNTINVNSFFFETACGTTSAPDLPCPAAQQETNVIDINPLTGTGRAGTACDSVNFTVAPTVNPSEYEFTPDAQVTLGPSSGGGDAATCVVDFTVDAVGLPVHDSSGLAGPQTSQRARALLEDTQTQEDATAAGSSTLTVALHCLHVVKDCTDATSCTGAIGVSVTATNCGNEGLTDLVVTDDHAGPLACLDTTLDVGESTTCTGSYSPVPGGYTNTITASAISAIHQEPVSPDESSVLSDTCTVPECPTVEITKSCENSTSCEDTSIEFVVTVTNTSTTRTLDSCTVTDPDCSPAPPAIVNLGPGDFVQYICTKTGTPGGSVSNSANVECISGADPASDSAESDICTIPECPQAEIRKDCDNSTSCTDTSIEFTITVSNTGPVLLDECTVTDPECFATPQLTGPIPVGGSAPPLNCSITGTAGGSVSNSAIVNCTANGGADSTGDITSNEATCTIPDCPCSVIIEKTVAPDDGSNEGTACDGTADGDFVETVTVDQTECVVYKICVTNTGEQVLDGNGVEVSDQHLGVTDYNFGNIGIGETVCRYVASEITADRCPEGICICTDVEGTNTAVITAAICTETETNACEERGSDCDDTADVNCTVPVTGCRMTGGHVAMAKVDATFEDPENGTKYTTGGQIGAPNNAGCAEFPPKGKCVEGECTGGINGGQACETNEDCPNASGRGDLDNPFPWGDWQHSHHSGPDDTGSIEDGAFSFHSGTAAAPNEAYIKSIICADTGWCVQARPAPNKQIFWEGTGVFRNAKGAKNKDIPLAHFDACEDQPVVWSKTGGTLHYYRAHVGDFGEPAGIRQKPADGCSWFNECGTEPGGQVGIEGCELTQDVCNIERTVNEEKTALHPLCEAQDCSECPDWYEIEIHCTADPASPVAYRVAHHITEGNFQLHPPVTDSCQPCGDGQCQLEFDETYLSCPEDCPVPTL